MEISQTSKNPKHLILDVASKFKYVKILKGNVVKQGLIDSGMFLPYFSLVNTIRWPKKVYASDGPYIIKCYLKNKKFHKYIPIVCSHYIFISLARSLWALP